jgi:FixJ family two-component response regulator
VQTITDLPAATKDKALQTPQRARVAIVDDDPLISQLITDMLSSLDVDVQVFAMGANLLKSATLQNVSAIILDLSIPDLDGFEIMDQLAIKKVGILVVLISGHESAVLHAAKLYGRGLGLNIRGAFAKPFTRADLIGALGLAT